MEKVYPYNPLFSPGFVARRGARPAGGAGASAGQPSSQWTCSPGSPNSNYTAVTPATPSAAASTRTARTASPPATPCWRPKRHRGRWVPGFPFGEPVENASAVTSSPGEMRLFARSRFLPFSPNQPIPRHRALSRWVVPTVLVSGCWAFRSRGGRGSVGGCQ